MKIKRIISLFLCFSIVSASFFTVNASELSVDLATQKQSEAEAYIIEMEQYLSRNSDGTLYIDAPKSTIASEYYVNAEAGLEATNMMIEAGYLAADKKGVITVTSKYVNHVTENYAKETGSKDFTITSIGGTIAINEASRASGVNKIVWTGLTFKLYLDSTNANIVAIGGASAASILLIWIPDSFLSKLLATVLYVYSGAIAIANAGGDGVIFHGVLILIPSPQFIIYWISSQ